MIRAHQLESFLAAEPVTALVEVASARGSTPREEGAWMLVAPARTLGTIGGGQLEYMAIDEARRMIAPVSVDSATTPPPPTPPHKGEGGSGASATPSPLWGGVRGGGQKRQDRETGRGKKTLLLDVPLGPEIGQCCGGRVGLAIERLGPDGRQTLLERVRAEDDALPQIWIFGGGHVGAALAAALSLLPVHVAVVETRAAALEGMPDGVATRLTPVPEEAVRAAPSGSAFIVLTHDHALDFLLVAEALRRRDAAYVGMIGSKTKKATFRTWYFREAGGREQDFSRLICPIGGNAIKDKRPAVIAALGAAEVMTALFSHGAAPHELPRPAGPLHA